MLFFLGACTSTGVKLDVAQHLSTSDARTQAQADIPPPVSRSYKIPQPKAQPKAETYSVVVNNVPAQELLFALARDAKVNVDIHPGITGVVTLNALDQTLQQLLSRISRQVDMRYELDGGNLIVTPDSPFLRNYKIDYVNLARDTTSVVAVSSQIGGGTGAVQGTATASSSGSFAKIENVSKNRFWESLIQNVKDLLQETDKIFPEGVQQKVVEFRSNQKGTAPVTTESGRPPESAPGAEELDGASTQIERSAYFREAASVIANAEAGVLSIRATARQHEKVQEFLDNVMNSAKRQVLIEATIAEVQLTRNYQQGINWSALNLFDTGLRVVQGASGTISGPSATLLELGYDSRGGNFTSAIKLLESFGTVKVLSSPKLSVMNNQTAVMKIVDDNIYFTFEIDEREGTPNSAAKTTIKSTVHSVPVGLVLSITPQIGNDESVTLNIRPSLSRVIGQKVDPSIQLAIRDTSIANTIPIIRARELDSVMRVGNGNIAVMGGLMEDQLNNIDDTVPGLGALPVIGALFQNKDDTRRKTELVIFVRPTVIRAEEWAHTTTLLNKLPGPGFFGEENTPRRSSHPEFSE